MDDPAGDPMKCPTCGVENSAEARFCKSCGAPQTPSAAPPPVMPPPPVYLPPPPTRRKLPHEDLMGLMGFAFFLIGVAVAFATDANLVGDFVAWNGAMGRAGTIFVTPPRALVVAAAWFFGVVGSLEFVAAVMRWSLRWGPLRAVSRILSGVGDLVFAALLLRYADKGISGAFLITVQVGIIAVLLLVYVTLGMYWSGGRSGWWLDSFRPPARQ